MKNESASNNGSVVAAWHRAGINKASEKSA